MNKTKTNHQTGYHKPVVNPTTNYPKDSHKAFCKRCLERYHVQKRRRFHYLCEKQCQITQKRRSGNRTGRR